MGVTADGRRRSSERKESFEGFVVANGNHSMWLARTLTRDWQEAEDLLQEALIRVYRAWDRRGAPESPRAYLATTMTRLAMRRARRAWHREVPVPPPLFEAHEGEGPPEDLADADELLGALALLPMRQRSAVVLRHLQDLSVKDTADAMRCSESTVKTLTQQGLTRLRETLSPEARKA